jgi:hypothetical protein
MAHAQLPCTVLDSAGGIFPSCKLLSGRFHISRMVANNIEDGVHCKYSDC